MTKKERGDRSDRCAEYLRRAGSLPVAMKLAREDGFTQNVSVWLSGLGKMLEGRRKRK